MNILEKIKAKYNTWIEKRFLARNGCKDWATYHRMTDTDINWRASRVKDFYHGYPYVYCIENHKHFAYFWEIHTDGMWVMSNWCDENCKDKYRFDFHRVIKNYWNDWEVNEIGGGDYIFAAFKNERDFTMFALKWS